VFYICLKNAATYLAPGSAPHIWSRPNARARAGALTIDDNGLGIDPKYCARIFGLFKRLHGREEFAGTGIGLAHAKKILERHGGEIGVEANPGGPGSRFWFTLPAASDSG
jgi:signal transduction histidine kinase